jgi:hypothetical protein
LARRVSSPELTREQAHNIKGSAILILGGVYLQLPNQKLYGRKVSAKEILIDGTVRTPRAGQALDSALTKHSPKGGHAFARL